MSAVSSPAHRLSGDFDSAHIFDPNFTADISNKMRVPHKLFVTGEGKNNGNDILNSANLMMENRDGPDKVSMKVPERIVVAGHDQHIGQKAPPRELRLEQVISVPHKDLIRVETPPRVLTLEDHTFPTVSDEEEKLDNFKDNGQVVSLDDTLSKITPDTPTDISALDSTLSPASELLLLRRQLIKLNRRVALLEHESQTRHQRDYVLCVLGVAYFTLKAVLWINRHW